MKISNRLSYDDANNKRKVLQAVKKHGGNLCRASRRLRNNKDIVMAALKKSGVWLKYASKELKDDKDVVIEAVKNSIYPLNYASRRLRNNKWYSRFLTTLQCENTRQSLHLVKE